MSLASGSTSSKRANPPSSSGNVLSALAALDFRFELLTPDDVAEVSTADASVRTSDLDDLIADYDRGDA